MLRANHSPGPPCVPVIGGVSRRALGGRPSRANVRSHPRSGSGSECCIPTLLFAPPLGRVGNVVACVSRRSRGGPRAAPASARTLGAAAARRAATSARRRRISPCLRAVTYSVRRQISSLISRSQICALMATACFRRASNLAWTCASPQTCAVPRPPMTVPLFIIFVLFLNC